MNIIVLSIDGLHNGMIGAFGNAWIQTPTLDALACQAVLYDRYYTTSMDLTTIFSSLWQSNSVSLPKQLSEQDFETILLTDDEDVFLHENANDFIQRHRLEPFSGEQAVGILEETQFFKGLATAVSLARQQNESNSANPYCLWTHLRGFRGLWDFPTEYREKYQGEEDPAPYIEVHPPKIICQNGEEIHPDDLQAVMEAYAGGVSVLDSAMAGLLESLEENELGKETILILVSTRGFSLGEHRHIGPNDLLYGENVQLPLMVRFPDGFFQTARSSALLQASDLADFLSVLGFNKDHNSSCDSVFDPDHSDSILCKLAREETETHRDFVCIENFNGEQALISPEWFLRRPDHETNRPAELYVKPDDHWEANDVAGRCAEDLEILSKMFDNKMNCISYLSK